MSWQSEWIGEHWPHIPQKEQRNLQLLFVAISVTALQTMGFLVFASWLGLRLIPLVLLVSVLMLGGLLYALRLRTSTRLISHLFIFVVWVAEGVLLWSLGGVTSSVMVGFLPICMLIYLLCTGRGRTLWLLLCVLEMALFGMWEWLVPGAFQYPLPKNYRLLFFPVAYAGTITVCILFIRFFEHLEKKSRQELETAAVVMKENQEELLRLNHALSQARDEAVQASRTKSSFLANMSHELRTPLNAIIGYSEIMLEDAEDLGQEEFIDDLAKVNHAGQHLLNLISDILDLSKIEAGRIDIHPERCELASFVGELRRSTESLVEKNKNTFQVSLDNSLDEIHTDQTRLRQILLNLLGNAFKFTSEGEVSLHVEREQRVGGSWVLFKIEDTGIGMSPEQMEKIFDVFTQADHLTTRKYGGTGLGLAISRRLAHRLGGDIGVQSVEGEGSIFTLELPVEAPEVAEIRKTAKRTFNNMIAVEQERPLVLVIDDDPNVHDLLMRTMRREHYNVVTAFDGEEGLRLAKELRPAVITLDALMPNMSGWEVLAKLKSHPQLASTPVVMISIVDESEKGFALGIDEFLTKPIKRERLLEVLEQLQRRPQMGPVLVVEDDPDTRELMKRLLARDGWEVVEAVNGKDALETLEGLKPSLILSDLMMPEMDGFAFIEAISQEERLNDVPVVVLTAMELTKEEEHLLNRRTESILKKGASPIQELEDKMLSLLHRMS